MHDELDILPSARVDAAGQSQACGRAKSARPLRHSAAARPPPCGPGTRCLCRGAQGASKITDCLSLANIPRSPAVAPAPATYEEALAELERLVQSMEGGQMPLDQLLASYRRGAELLQSCRQRLQAVEEQVKVLEDGQLKPWVGT